MKFEDLRVRQEAVGLYQDIDTLFNTPSTKYFFKDQVLRASLSISNNIAEGFERQSNKELKRFLYIAKGSCGEVRSMLHISKNGKYISEEIFKSLYKKTSLISVMLYKYIQSLPG